MLKQAAAMNPAAANAKAAFMSAAPSAPTCDVLVCSCDAYSDLWQPFFQLFRRYWPDCPFAIYLGAGEKTFADAQITTLHSPDPNWTSSFRFFLEHLERDYVLVLLEDFFLDQPVDSRRIQALLNDLEALGASVVRLTPKPGPDARLPAHPGLGRLDANAPYRVSLQAAIWHRRDLLALLCEGESAWEFEWNGTERSRLASSPFLATEQPVLYYQHVIERGAWFWSAARKYRREAIACDFTARPVMSPYTAVKKALNRMRKKVTNAVLPPGLRRRR